MEESFGIHLQSPAELAGLMAKSQQGDIESTKLLILLQKNPNNISFYCDALSNYELDTNTGFHCIRSLTKLVNPLNENILEIQNLIKNTIYKKADLFSSTPQYKSAIKELFIQTFRYSEKLALSIIEELLSGQRSFLILGLQFASEYFGKTGNSKNLNIIFIKCVGPLLNLESNLIELQLSAEFYTNFIKSFENKELPKITITQSLVIGPERLFHHALVLPDPVAVKYLEALDDIIRAPLKLFDSKNVYVKFLQSFISSYVETVKSKNFTFTIIKPMLDICISILRLPVVQEECKDTELIMSLFESVNEMHQYTATIDRLSSTPIDEEKCLKAFSIFFDLEAITMSGEAMERAKTIVESAIDLCLSSIYENGSTQAMLLINLFLYDPVNGVYEELAKLMGINRELNTEKIIRSFTELTYNRNIAIAASIEIAGQMILAAKNIEFDIPLFEAVSTLCREMEQIDTKSEFSESNSPRLWTELAFVHFFEAIVKAYANSPNGDQFFTERVSDVAIFYERILFMLQLDSVQTSEIHTMCRSVAITSLPPNCLEAFAASESIMETITQHFFPFILNECYLEDAKELYHSFFEIARIAGDEAVVKVLETLGSCIETNPVKHSIPIHIMDIAMESVIAGPVAFEYMRDSLIPSLANATEVDHHLRVAEFLEKLAFTIYHREPFEKMSGEALSTFSAIIEAASNIVEQLSFDPEATQEFVLKTLAKIVGAVSGALGWESINMGVLCVYGDEKIVSQLFKLFDVISNVPINLLFKRNSFRQGYVSIVGYFIQFLSESEFLHSETFVTPLINFTKIAFNDPILSETEILTLSEAVLKFAPPEAIVDRDLVFGVVVAAQVAAPASLRELAFAALRSDAVDWAQVVASEPSIGDERATYVADVMKFVHSEKAWLSSDAWISISSMFDIVRGPIQAILMREE